jgi:hypothetical protein
MATRRTRASTGSPSSRERLRSNCKEKTQREGYTPGRCLASERRPDMGADHEVMPMTRTLLRDSMARIYQLSRSQPSLALMIIQRDMQPQAAAQAQGLQATQAAPPDQEPYRPPMTCIFNRIGPVCFGPAITGEKYPKNFKGP